MRACLIIVLSFVAALAGTESMAGTDAMTLSPSSPVLSVPASALDRSTGDRFVLVDLAEINNPDNFSLSFKVYFQSPEGDSVYLGSFAPYPAQRPGRFIVSTRGLVGDAGRVLLCLDLSDDDVIPEVLEVRIRMFMLTDHHPEASIS